MLKKLMRIAGFTAVTVTMLIVIIFGGAVWYVRSAFDGFAAFPADCALVFGAAVHRTDTAGPGIRRRVSTAVDLHKEEKVKMLFFTGGKGSPGQKSEAAVMLDYAVELGMDEREVVLEQLSHSTYENLLYARPLMDACTSVVGISDRYHLARIDLLASKLDWNGFETYPATETSTGAFELRSVVREALGILYYSVPGTV